MSKDKLGSLVLTVPHSVSTGFVVVISGVGVCMEIQALVSQSRHEKMVTLF